MSWYNSKTVGGSGKKITAEGGIPQSVEADLGMKRLICDDIIVNVENQAGTIRMGTGKDGKEWRTKMKYDYGFIHCVKGADDEGLDVYIGSDQKAKFVYVIHQNDPQTGEYDEDKCMVCFPDEKEAKEAYLDHYDSPKYFGSMDTMKMADFKDIVKSGKRGGKVKFKVKKAKKKANNWYRRTI